VARVVTANDVSRAPSSLEAPSPASPLCAAPSQLERVAVHDGQRAWTWREIHSCADALSQKFEHGATLCNLCHSRLGFLITWLAALRRSCVQLLPPSGGDADLGAMLASCAEPLIVIDDESLRSPHWPAHATCIVYRPQPVPCRDDAALRWLPPWDAPLLRMYTSGSTGLPQAQVKTLRQFERGARVLGARLAQDVELASLDAIVCSVPPQHMFGVEASTMLSLVHGISLLDSRPLLPADVGAALERCGRAVLWTTTPLHLRALVQAHQRVPNCALVVSSTMPLSTALAAQAEALVNAPVLEVYGSTETGVVAMRRSVRDSRWRPVDGVRLEPQAGSTRVWGSHFDSPRDLADEIEPAGEGFILLGRQADMVKIGGRRASLAGLNLLLAEMPGLEDGVFYLPSSEAGDARLVLIHAGAALDRAHADAWLRHRIDPIFLPRTWIRVDRLPRSGNGQLTRRALDELYLAWRASRRG
jgi:acyl-coenzyme A synthetase/AMP-(fatty) acid ligase